MIDRYSHPAWRIGVSAFLVLSAFIALAPIAWIVLDRLGLKGLRGFATVESFVPFTQMLPTMTVAWLGVRLFGRERFVDKGTYGS